MYITHKECRSYYIPPSLNHHPFETQLNALEEFWDSEWPRVGELGAKGWAAWEASGRPEYEPPSSTSSRKLPETRMSDPFQKWATMESVADRTFRLPTRSTDEDSDSDPYSTILFADIRPLLLPLSSQYSKQVFRLVWVSFLGLHVPGFVSSLSGESSDDRWAYTHLTAPSYLAAILPSGQDHARLRITADAHAGVLVGRERAYASGVGPVKGWGYGVVGYLEEIVEGKRMWADEDVRAVDADLVREVFRQCRFGEDAADPEWDVLALAFEAAVNAKR